jgi:hypothetical protein
MLAFFLLVILVCVIVGLVGAVIHGLLWLTAIAAVVFVLHLIFTGMRVRSRRSRS